MNGAREELILRICADFDSNSKYGQGLGGRADKDTSRSRVSAVQVSRKRPEWPFLMKFDRPICQPRGRIFSTGGCARSRLCAMSCRSHSLAS